MPTLQRELRRSNCAPRCAVRPSANLCCIVQYSAMAYVVIRVLVNALALALMLSILPGIGETPSAGTARPDVSSARPRSWRHQRSHRPFAIILTARLLIWSWACLPSSECGVVLAVGHITGLLIVRPPQLLWIVIASLLVAIAVLVMEARLDSPLANENLQMRPYWRFLPVAVGTAQCHRREPARIADQRHDRALHQRYRH